MFSLTFTFQENPEPDRASIYRSVIINTSKEMMCFSDYPIPGHFSNYMHNSQIMEYFRMYADHFQLTKYIRFQVRSSSLSHGVREAADDNPSRRSRNLLGRLTV